MHSPMLFLLMALITSAGCTAGSEATNKMPAQRPMPASLPPTFPRVGVDHVVTYASWRGWGPKDGDRAVVTRHGPLVRLETRLIATRRSGEPEVAVSFSNLATGSSISVGWDALGALAGVTLWQGEEPQPPIYRHRLTWTQEVEEIAGERCTVWRAEPESSEGVTYSACISADGVLLRDTVLFRDGTAMSERRALSVERRPVAPAEVLPPRAALDWAHWADKTAEPHGENYALRLAGRAPGSGELGRTFLADGLFRSEEQRRGDKITSLTVAGSGAQLSYSGERPQLSISHASGPSESGPVSWFTSEPMADRQPLSLLGEPCDWVDASVGVQDFSRIECRTADGLPLIIEERTRGYLSGRWEAVSLTRGQTPTGSVRPPAYLLRWNRWGWPMLDEVSPISPARPGHHRSEQRRGRERTPVERHLDWLEASCRIGATQAGPSLMKPRLYRRR